jgi:hypothetical protein
MKTYLSPARRAPAVSVLDKQMRCAYLALRNGHTLGSWGGGGAVVGCHVVLQLLGVGACWRLPARDLLGRIEVVW